MLSTVRAEARSTGEGRYALPVQPGCEELISRDRLPRGRGPHAGALKGATDVRSSSVPADYAQTDQPRSRRLANHVVISLLTPSASPSRHGRGSKALSTNSERLVTLWRMRVTSAQISSGITLVVALAQTHLEKTTLERRRPLGVRTSLSRSRTKRPAGCKSPIVSITKALASTW